MRLPILFVPTVLGAALPAQLATNPFGIYPATTSYTSRSGLPGSSHGDLCLALPGAAFRGLGQFGPLDAPGRIDGFRALLQDQDASTPETYSWSVLSARADGRPGAAFYRSGPIPTPPGATAGPEAWLLSSALTAPVRPLPKDATCFLAVGLPSNARWPLDGLSVHHADYSLGTTGDTPRSDAPNLTWTVDRDRGDLVGQPSPRVPALFFLTPGLVLRAGADVDPAEQRGPNPTFGAAGLYPDRTKRMGLAFLVTDANRPNETFAVLGSPLGFGPLRLPFLTGTLWIVPPFAPDLFLTGTLDAAGRAEGVVPFAPFPLTPTFGALYFQAVTLPAAPGGTFGVSNATSAADS